MSQTTTPTNPGIQARLSAWICCALLSAGSAHTASHYARVIGGMADDALTAMTRTADGGWILVGHTRSSGSGGADAWVARTDASDNLLWQRTYGGPANDRAQSIVPAIGGGFVVAGWTTSFGAGGQDAWILRLDESGNVLWQRAYCGSADDIAAVIRETASGRFLAAGQTLSFGAGATDLWAFEIDTAGNLLWQRSYGGSGTDTLDDLQRTSDGGYLMAGQLSNGAGSSDGWLLRLSASGSVLWHSTLGGPAHEQSLSARQTPDGGLVLAGAIELAGNVDLWVARLDGAGNVQWQKTIGGSGLDQALDLLLTNDGGYLLAGSTSSSGNGAEDAWLVRLDATGNVIWQKTYGGFNSEFFRFIQSSGSGYAAGGRTASFGSGGFDIFVADISSDGSIDPGCGTLVHDSAALSVASAATAQFPPATTNSAFGIVTATSVIAADAALTGSYLCRGAAGPFISSISSKTARPGSFVTIRGQGFSSTKSKNVVYFGRKKTSGVRRATATSLKVAIPKGVRGTVQVSVVVDGVESNRVDFTVK